MRMGKRWIASLMALILIIQCFSVIDISQLQLQKAYADTIISPMPTDKAINSTAIPKTLEEAQALAAASNLGSTSKANTTVSNLDSTAKTSTLGLHQLDSSEIDLSVFGNQLLALDTTTPTAISIPTNVNVTPTAITLSVSWDAVADAQSYEVSLNNIVTNVIPPAYTYSGLEPNTQYTVKIRTVNPYGTYGLIGDINGDETVDSIDYAILKAYLLSPEATPSEETLWVSDVDGDGSIYSIDLVLLKKKLLDTGYNFPKSLSAWSNEIAEYTKLSTPINHETTTSSGISVDLTWDAVAGATGYKVYRDNSEVGTSVTNSYSDTGLTANTTYEYKIMAYNTDTVSALSEPWKVTTLDTEQIAPTAPGNLKSTAINDTMIELSWDASTDDIGVTGYDIYIGANLLTTVTSTTYTAVNLTPNTKYTFVIRAKDTDGNDSANSITTTTTKANITAFAFQSVAPKIIGKIYESTKPIILRVPEGTDVSSLVATFTANAASVKVGTTEQISGTTPNDFTHPVTYTVVAANGSTVDYTVTVTETIGRAGFVQVSSDLFYTVALREDGTVWEWGDTWVYFSSIPVQVQGLSGVKSVSTGGCYTVALKDDGTVWFWGNNLMDVAVYDFPSTPIQAVGLSGVKAVYASGDFQSGDYILAIKEDGTVWTLRMNTGDLSGNGIKQTHIPEQIAGISDVKEVSISKSGKHVLALKEDGTVWAWGLNNYGQLGNGSIDNVLNDNGPIDSFNPPGQVVGLSGVKEVEARWGFSMAVKEDGSLWMWGGYNPYGVKYYCKIPIQVIGINDINDFEFFDTDEGMTIVLKEDGTVWALDQSFVNSSSNTKGMLGNATVSPRQVNGLSNIKSIDARLAVAFAIKEDGNVWSCGYNNNGQLGDGTRNDSSIPVRVTFIEDQNLRSITVNNELILNFDENVTAYTVLTTEVDEIPLIKAVAYNPKATCTVTRPEPNTAVITVTAQDRVTKKNYTLHFTKLMLTSCVTKICTTPEIPTYGDIVTITAQIKNLESVPAAINKISYLVDGKEIYVDTSLYIIEAGAEIEFSTSIGTEVLTTPGNHIITVIVNDDSINAGSINVEVEENAGVIEVVEITSASITWRLTNAKDKVFEVYDDTNTLVYTCIPSEIACDVTTSNLNQGMTYRAVIMNNGNCDDFYYAATEGTGNDGYGSNQDETFDDYKPSISVLSNNDIIFNDPNMHWNYIGRDVKELLNIICLDPNLANGDLTAHQQMPEVQFWNTKILPNRQLTLTAQQLEFLYYIDPNGVIDYLTFCTDDNVTYRSASLRNEVFKRLTGKEIEYYKKTIFGWEPTTQTSGDGVRSNADMALTWDRPISLADLATLGIAVGTILIALPEVLMFIEGVEAFGFYNALTAYSYGVLGSQLASWRVLTQLQNRGDISDYGIEHIFFGTAFKGKASGYHYEGISSNATIEAGTISEVDSFGVYRAKVLVDGIAKRTGEGYSTFFPKNWTPQQVVNAVKEAFGTKVLTRGDNVFVGTTNFGMKIEMMLDQNGLIKSAYPLWNP